MTVVSSLVRHLSEHSPGSNSMCPRRKTQGRSDKTQHNSVGAPTLWNTFVGSCLHSPPDPPFCCGGGIVVSHASAIRYGDPSYRGGAGAGVGPVSELVMFCFQVEEEEEL